MGEFRFFCGGSNPGNFPSAGVRGRFRPRSDGAMGKFGWLDLFFWFRPCLWRLLRFPNDKRQVVTWACVDRIYKNKNNKNADNDNDKYTFIIIYYYNMFFWGAQSHIFMTQPIALNLVGGPDRNIGRLIQIDSLIYYDIYRLTYLLK